MTRHHVKARRRGGTKCANNILVLDELRHISYHALFGNRTLTEAAALLLRTDELVRWKE